MQDPGGGRTSSWSRVTATDDDRLHVLVAEPSAAERESGAQEGVEFTHLLTLSLEDDVRRGDRLVVTGQPDAIEVVSLPRGTHSVAVHARGRAEPWDEPTSTT